VVFPSELRWTWSLSPNRCPIGQPAPKLPDLRRKQHATRRGGANEDVSVSVRVSSALRLASDSRGHGLTYRSGNSGLC